MDHLTRVSGAVTAMQFHLPFPHACRIPFPFVSGVILVTSRLSRTRWYRFTLVPRCTAVICFFASQGGFSATELKEMGIAARHSFRPSARCVAQHQRHLQYISHIFWVCCFASHLRTFVASLRICVACKCLGRFAKHIAHFHL